MEAEREAIDLLLTTGKQLAVPIERTIDGRQYINKELKPISTPLVTALRISTLKSLMELCSGKFSATKSPTIGEPAVDGFEGFDSKYHVVHVVSHSQVQVVTAVSDVWKNREILIDCVLAEVQTFPFNKFISQDEFIIGLLASFGVTEDKAPLVKLAGNATAEAILTSLDDGVTQSVSTRVGATLQDTTAVKGLVKLAPWRTFRDVSQPASNFIFRVKKVGDNPQFALFEADGGAWKLEALDNIARKLSAGLTDATVVS